MVFLQAKVFDREIFMKPHEDFRMPGTIWKLRKPLYGLDNASRKFWLKVKEVFLDLGLRVMDRDEAFYYLHEDSDLKGVVQTDINDFFLAGTPEFVEMVIQGLSESLIVSKEKRGRFQFTALDVQKHEDGVVLLMEDYISSLEDINEIRKAEREEPLTRCQMKEYRKIASKIAWLANNIRPDLSYMVLQLAKKNNSTTFLDLRYVNIVLKKVWKKESKFYLVRFPKK